MGRRKGEITKKHRNRSHPFQVEILVPIGGLLGAMDMMYRRAAPYDHVRTGHREGERDLMRWCFCSRDVADAFAAECGGRRIDLPVDPIYLKIDNPDARERERRAKAARFGLELIEAAR